MLRRDIITEVRDICLARYEQIEDWNHDINHIKRVVKYSRKIAEAEKFRSKDIFLVELAAWLHDLGRVGEEKNVSFKKANHAERSYRQSRNILKPYWRFIGREDTVKVLQAIREHSQAILDHKDNRISRCLQDGDRGASLNTIGIISMLDYHKIIEDLGPVVSIKQAKEKKMELLNKIKEKNLQEKSLEKLKNLLIFYTGDRDESGNWKVMPLHFESSRKMFRKGVREIEEFMSKIQNSKEENNKISNSPN